MRTLIVVCVAASLNACITAADSGPTCADTLSQRRAQAHSVVARMRVVIHDEKRNQQFTLDGACIADDAGRARLRLTAESGQLVFDWAVHDGQIEACVPVKECVYAGPCAALRTDGPASAQFLLRCANLFELYFPTLAPKTAVARIGERVYCNARAACGPQSRLERYTCDLAARGAAVHCLELFDTGFSGGRVEFSDYTPQAQSVSLPHKLTLYPPGGRYRIELDMEDVSLNSTLAPAKFTLVPPPGYRRADLLDALREDAKPLE